MIDAVIQRLRARCASFAGAGGTPARVAGAAEFAALEPNAKVVLPAAFVVPREDKPGQPTTGTKYRQVITDAIAVIVILDNTSDRRGQSAITGVHALRAELWRALLAWEPGAEYDGLVYEGGQLLQMDAARLYYQFDFSAESEISEADTALAADVFPDLLEVRIDVDAIDPMVDPNNVPGQHYQPDKPTPRLTGPDGRVEASMSIPLTPR